MCAPFVPNAKFVGASVAKPLTYLVVSVTVIHLHLRWECLNFKPNLYLCHSDSGSEGNVCRRKLPKDERKRDSRDSL